MGGPVLNTSLYYCEELSYIIAFINNTDLV